MILSLEDRLILIIALLFACAASFVLFFSPTTAFLSLFSSFVWVPYFSSAARASSF
jgi:hypothetical protein